MSAERAPGDGALGDITGNRTQTAVTIRKPRAVGLSRERIVSEAVRYLRAHPHEQLTIAKAGAAVDATSMAIYRHFRDGADLADAIVTRVLKGLGDEIPHEADWRAQVRAWIEAIYRRLVETPQCVEMLMTSRGLSIAWVRATAILRQSLIAGGIEGKQLSQASFWISMTVGGFARQTLAIPLDVQVASTVAAIARLAPEEIAEMTLVAEDIPDLFSHALEIMIERTLASVEMLVGKPRSSPGTDSRL